MCSGRDTYDIEEYEKEQNSLNIQIQLLGDMLVDSEPEIFGRGNAVLMTNEAYLVPVEAGKTLKKMRLIARWHGALQAKFNKQFGIL